MGWFRQACDVFRGDGEGLWQDGKAFLIDDVPRLVSGTGVCVCVLVCVVGWLYIMQREVRVGTQGAISARDELDPIPHSKVQSRSSTASTPVRDNRGIPCALCFPLSSFVFVFAFCTPYNYSPLTSPLAPSLLRLLHTTNAPTPQHQKPLSSPSSSSPCVHYSFQYIFIQHKDRYIQTFTRH